ncbi:hypothetical protein ACFFTM_09095 [Pseudoduganella plicata]|uniref:Uncharacterized protein n=1 Tax=Pseudoduganella plicata TaxID=321984 RepID=A0ABX5S539_9BURK|nr:hypothetical protein [Pseudoduganella plicata]QBQ35370.1 hypothetical protein E1742_03720 [Pseudoduganella plicata]
MRTLKQGLAGRQGRCADVRNSCRARRFVCSLIVSAPAEELNRASIARHASAFIDLSRPARMGRPENIVATDIAAVTARDNFTTTLNSPMMVLPCQWQYWSAPACPVRAGQQARQVYQCEQLRKPFRTDAHRARRRTPPGKTGQAAAKGLTAPAREGDARHLALAAEHLDQVLAGGASPPDRLSRPLAGSDVHRTLARSDAANIINRHRYLDHYMFREITLPSLLAIAPIVDSRRDHQLARCRWRLDSIGLARDNRPHAA